MSELKQLVGRGTWARARANTSPEQPKAARWVRGLRARLGMSQSALGRAIGVASLTVARWERHGGQMPRQCHVARLQILERKLTKA